MSNPTEKSSSTQEPSTLPPNKKRKIFRKFLKIGLVLMLVGFLAILTLPFYSFLFIGPITSTITNLTGRQSTIKSLSINLLGSSLSLGEFKIKELEGSEDFVSLQKMEIDFSIFPLLSGNIHVPKIEISGLQTKVRKNASGTFNFDSILKELAPKETGTAPLVPEKTETTEKEALTVLPEVFIDLQITDVDVSFIDEQNKQSLEVQDFSFSCKTEGLNNIQYSSKLKQVQFSDKKETPKLATLVYQLDGKVALSLDAGKPVVSASNKLVLSPVSLQGFGPQAIDNVPVELFYDLNLNLNQGLFQIQKMGLTSEYLTLLVSQANLSQLNKIQEESSRWKQASSSNQSQNIRQLLENLNFEDWKGNLDISLDLNQIQKTFGGFLTESSRKQLSQMGGELKITGALQGKANGIVELSETLVFDQLHLAGEIENAQKEKKPYKIALSEIAQHFKINADFKKRHLSTDFKWNITDDQKAQLLQIANNSDIQKLFEGQSMFELKTLENTISLDFGVLNHVLADFIPEKTSMKGTFENKDTLAYTASSGLAMQGQTDVHLQILSPETQQLPPLKITGSRDLNIGFDAKNQMQQIQINQFHLNTPESKMLSLVGSGVLNLQESQAQSILLKLGVQFKDLEPYLTPFVSGIKLDGTLQHQTMIAKAQEGIKIQAEGHLDSFFVSLPEKLDYAIKETRWGSHVALALKENQLDSIQMDQTHLIHPALEIHVSGNIKNKPELNIQQFNILAKIHAENLQKEVLTQLVARQDKETQQKLTKDLTLQGRVDFNVNIQGTPTRLSVDISADASPLVVELKDPQQDVLFHKKSNYNLLYRTKIGYTQEETKNDILVENSQIQLGRAQIVIGSLLYNNKSQILSAPDGKAPVTLVDVQNFKLAEISEMVPMVKKLELDETQIQFKFHEVFANLPKKETRGKLFCKVLVPPVDFPKIQKSMKKKETAQTTENPKDTPATSTQTDSSETPAPTEEEPFKGLDEATRRLLEGFGIDMEIIIQSMTLNDLNKFTDLKMAMTLNKEKIDNHFHTLVQGKATASFIDIQGLFDLSQEHPPCKFVYDIQDLPYIVEFFSPLSESLEGIVQFPLAEKIRFADPTKVTFTLKGEDRWIGIDSRLIKKSLVSTTTACKISGGTFDLGYDLLSFMDVQQLQKDIEAQIAPLKNTLKMIQGEHTDGLAKIKQVETAKAELNKKIEEAEKAKQDLLKTIDTLKPLAAFNPTSKAKLQEAEKKVKSYETDITKYKNQQTEMSGSIKKLQDQLASVQKRIEETEAKIKKAQDDFVKNMKIENPFTFNFDGISIAMDITNQKPVAQITEFKNSTFSRVNYIEFTFAPSSQNLLKITGWYSLDGAYSFSFIPSEQQLNQLSKTIPGLGDLIKKQGGVLWTSEGFQPNPLTQKR